ncbi:MAG: hypothetical protein VKK97_03530 [Synechococcaceae cyanobacterium]|nr:hypothetical protein [Synechococcaceae cyanobacterium]
MPPVAIATTIHESVNGPVDGLEQAICSAAGYLSAQILETGLFLYERDAARPEWNSERYNLLRHAGCVYALTQHHHHCGARSLDPRVRLAGLKLLDWLRPLPDAPGTLAAWSLPGINDTVAEEQVKLGGSALTLLALTELDAITGALRGASLLAELAAGLMAMQRTDGSFISKVIPTQGGFQTGWSSLFYPGEAALALLRLARHQPAEAEPWRGAALLALQHLANSRRGTPDGDIPLDHWALIATGELLEQTQEPEQCTAALLEHAQQVVKAMLSRQLHGYADPLLHGAFSRNGSSTTTATCLEGLIAIRPWLQGDRALSENLEQACRQGLHYLRRCQLQEGQWRGAIPAMVKPDRGLVRIDYVQHGLSAFLGMSKFPAALPELPQAPTGPEMRPRTGLLTATLCAEALDLGLRFLLAQMGTDGRITYEVPLQPGPAEDSHHQVREAGALWGLSLYLHRPTLQADQRRAIWQALQAGLARQATHSICEHGQRRPLPPQEPSGALGTAALLGLSLVEMLTQADCPQREERQRLLQETLTFILSCRQSSGRYHSRYDLRSGRPLDDANPYFDGEVCLLLAKASWQLEMTAYAVPASIAADAMFEAYADRAIHRRVLSDDCKGFYQWGSMAMTELHLLQPHEPRWGDRVLAMADWILEVHQVLSRKRNTGYAFEGLISAFRLAHGRGEQTMQRRLHQAIDSGLARLCTWQLGASVQCESLQRLHPVNPQAIGGVLGGRHDTLIRIDTVQHQMHALLLAEQHLEM